MNKRILIALICLLILIVVPCMSGLPAAFAAPAGGAGSQTPKKAGFVQYELTIGRPPLAGATVSGLTTWPWHSTPSGAMVTNNKGVIKAWLPKEATMVTAQVGCSIYTGITSGSAPHKCVLINAGIWHSFSTDWTYDETAHWHEATCGHDEIDGYAAHLGGAATCLESAVCEVCEVPYGEPLGHDFETFFTVDIIPTCSNEGGQSRHCTRCEAVTDITPLPATDEHTFSPDWTSDASGHWHASTCAHTDLTSRYEPHTPEADDGDCTTKVLCSVCGYEIVPAEAEHFWGYAEANATEHWFVCVSDGCTKKSATKAHYGGMATCSEQAMCDGCNEYYGECADHTPASEYGTAEEPGCETEGRETLYCTVCGEELDVRVIPASGHSWGGWTLVTAPTCAEEGEEKRVCEADSSHLQTREIPIDPDAHAWDAGTVTTRATCTVEGVRTFTCLNNPAHLCTEVIPISEHTHTITVIDPPGACLEVYLYDESSGSATPIASGAEVACGTRFFIDRRLDSAYNWVDEGVYVNGSAYGEGVICMVRSDVVITGRTEARTFKVTITAGANGQCTPSGEVIVNYGADLTVAITPSEGYVIKRVIVDGTDIGALASHTFLSVREDYHSLSAEFAKAYNITATAGEHGQISPPGVTAVEAGGKITYTITPDPGYWVKDVVVDGWWNAGAVTTFTFNGVMKAQRIHVTFVEACNITASAGEHGQISPSGLTAVIRGTDQAFTITPDWSYTVKDVLVDGASVGAKTSYTFSSVDENHTIHAEFEALPLYCVMASAGEHGQISPSGETTVPNGTDLAYTITPDSGYRIKDVKVDGASVGAMTSYTFTFVQADHTIWAEFEIIPFAITASAGDGGTISPAGVTTVLPGTIITYTITPHTGYRVKEVMIDGGWNAGAVTSHTFNGVYKNYTIHATFYEAHNITASAGAHGTISPLGVATVNGGDNKTYTITPDPGYAVKDVLVDGASVGAVTTYTFTFVHAAHTISAEFVKTYGITASAGARGTISPSGTTAVNGGDSKTYTITPDPGYRVMDVKVDGASVGAITSYTFTFVQAEHTIEAMFQAVYSITATAGAHGTISPSGTAVVDAGAIVTYTITPDPGYRVKEVWIDGGWNAGAIASHTFNGVNKNYTIHATFWEPYEITASAGLNGRISPSGTTIVEGGGDITYTFTPTPDIYFKVKDVLVDGVSMGEITSYTFTNVRAAHTIAVEFEMKPFYCSVTAFPGSDGTISPAGLTEVEHGHDITFTITPNPRRIISSVVLDGTYMVVEGPVSTPITYTLTNVTSPHTISVNYYLMYDITATAGEHGQISPSGIAAYHAYTDQLFTITPDPGYKVKNVQVNGYDWFVSGPMTSLLYQHIDHNVTIHALFKENPHYITASAGANGSISPSGSVKVLDSLSQTFTITPGAGYMIADVKVDGASVGRKASYTFNNVTANHTIEATFAIPHEIEARPSSNGTITPAGVTQVPQGMDQTYTITPDIGYHIELVHVDGVPSGQIANYTFLNVTGPHTIQAKFEQTDYTITIPATTGGRITALEKARYNETVRLDIEPEMGWRLKPGTLKANGVAITGDKFIMPAQNVTITAEFEQYLFRVTVSQNSNGRIDAPPGLLEAGTLVTLMVTPDPGYRLAEGSVRVNGYPISGTSFTMPAQNVTVSGTFVPRSYAITIAPTSNGTVTASLSSAIPGTVITLTVTPAAGYHLREGSLKVNGEAIYGATFPMPMADVLITAYFE